MAYSKANIDYLKTTYPHLTDADIAWAIKAHARLLTTKEKDRALLLTSQGLVVEDVAAQLGHTHDTIKFTKLCDLEFRKNWGKARKRRARRVESILVKFLLGEVKETKLTKVAVLDDNGNPKVDANGNEVLRITKVEETHLAPPASLIIDYLKKKLPQEYRDVKPAEQASAHEVLPLEELKSKLDKLKKAK